MSNDRPALLALRALGVGDLLTAVPALRGLAAAFPEHRKVLAAPGYLSPLAELTGAVDEVVDSAPLAPLDGTLERPAVAVNLHGRGPQSHAVLGPLRPERLIAFAHADVPGTAGFPEWRPGEHEVHRWCRLLHEFGIPADPSALDLPPPPVEAPPHSVDATILHPGAKAPERRWPLERWIAVARAEAGAGRRVIVTGSRDEVPLARRICEAAGLDDGSVLAGGTDVAQLAAAVAAARVVVSNDTGVAHLATALGTPSVVLFGRMSPAEWGPPPDRPMHRAIWKGPRPGAADAELLADIGLEEVLDAISGVAPRAASREIGVPNGGHGRALAAARGEGEGAG